MLKRWDVFDCMTTIGVTLSLTGPEWLARFAAVILSKATGRFHDYAPAGWGWEGSSFPRMSLRP